MIYETVITTTDEAGEPHIAPFGVRERQGWIVIAPYRPSASLDNMLRSRCAVLNATDDVRAFAGPLTGRRQFPVRKAERINGWVLDSALFHRELRLESVTEDSVRPALEFRIVHEVMHAPFPGFNRAQAAVLEAAVLVSRLQMLPLEKIALEVGYLSIAIEKTAGPREREAWGWLMEAIDNHTAELRGENLA